MYFGFWLFFVLYVLKFEIKRQKVPTLNEIPGFTPDCMSIVLKDISMPLKLGKFKFN